MHTAIQSRALHHSMAIALWPWMRIMILHTHEKCEEKKSGSYAVRTHEYSGELDCLERNFRWKSKSIEYRREHCQKKKKREIHNCKLYWFMFLLKIILHASESEFWFYCIIFSIQIYWNNKWHTDEVCAYVFYWMPLL